MKCSFSQVFFLLITLAGLYLSPQKCFAQYHDEDAEPIKDTTNKFCQKLALVMSQANTSFDAAKAELLDTIGQKTWEVKYQYQIPGSRTCTIYQSFGKTTFVAFFITKDNKEALGGSYNNLHHQLMDCLGKDYTFKDKKTTNIDRLMGDKIFECEIAPVTKGLPDQAEIRISIKKTPAGNFVLMMEMIASK